MTEIRSLRDRVEWFVENDGYITDFHALLIECIREKSLDALVCVRRLYEHMYGGYTFNMELKAPAASALLIWKELGLKALVEGALQNSKSKNISITLQLLAALAAGEELPLLGRVRDDEIAAAIQDAITSMPNLAQHARLHLIEFILAIPDDEDAISYVASAMTMSSVSGDAARRELFAAMSKRMLAVSTPVLNTFDALIRDDPSNEPAFQAFLTQHPQILDPLAIRIWPQPNLFGFKEPDYVVQRADGTYMVVEIECPAKSLVTGGGQLTSEVTHAEMQAADYRRYLIQKFSEFAKHFPNFQEPDCLVVVGLERTLTSKQKQVLHDANNGRNYLRIVGFDWLLDRARTIAANVVQPQFEVISLRVS